MNRVSFAPHVVTEQISMKQVTRLLAVMHFGLLAVTGCDTQTETAQENHTREHRVSMSERPLPTAEEHGTLPDSSPEQLSFAHETTLQLMSAVEDPNNMFLSVVSTTAHETMPYAGETYHDEQMRLWIDALIAHFGYEIYTKEQTYMILEKVLAETSISTLSKEQTLRVIALLGRVQITELERMVLR